MNTTTNKPDPGDDSKKDVSDVVESVFDKIVESVLGPTPEDEARRHWDQYSDTNSR